jgi:hypothetical protein
MTGSYIPSEKEGKQGTSKIQPLISVVISIIKLPTAQSSQQQPMYHVPNEIIIIKKVKVRLSPQQAAEAYRVVKC